MSTPDTIEAIEITVDDYVNMNLHFISQTPVEEDGTYWTVWRETETDKMYKIKTYLL